MRNTSTILWVLLGALVFFACISDVAAQSIYAPSPPTITTIDINHFRWEYQVLVTQGSEVLSGDGFTIYDFAGYQGVAASLPPGWSVDSSQTNAPDYPFETRATTDNPSVTDLIVSYAGSPIGSTASSTSLGTFSFISTFNQRADSFFESADHSIFNGQGQTDDHNTQVPVGVPEPAAIWGLSFLGAIFSARPSRKNVK